LKNKLTKNTKPNVFANLEKWPVHIQEAIKGDTEAAKQVLIAINRYLKNGEMLPKQLNDYLICAIAETIEGSNPKKAFHLSGRQGKQKGLSKDMRELVADRVYILSLTYGMHRSAGNTPEKNGAYYQAGIDFDISPETAERCFVEFGSGEGHRINDKLRQEHGAELDK
jgi:hypothetical protein